MVITRECTIARFVNDYCDIDILTELTPILFNS